jgi:hypothetical protein
MCGGGIPIVSDLGSSLEDVGKFAGNVVESQIQEAANDPLKAAAKGIAIASGNAWALPIIEGVDTLEEGGTLEEGLISGGKSYAGQQVGAELGSQLRGGGFATTGEDFDMGGGGGFYDGESTLLPSEAPFIDQQDGEFLLTSDGAPITDYSREVTLTPGGNAVPATTLPSEMAAIDAEIEAAAKALPSTISPMQALQGLRAAGGLLGGGQQPQQQQMPQMQMGGRTQMPQGAVDYSGIYNLLALQRARNPNSLLG